MHKIYLIARREYLEAIKTRTFIFSILITPLLIFGMGWVNSRMEKSMRSGPQPARRLAVADLSGRLAKGIQNKLEDYNKTLPQRKIDLREVAAEPGKAAARIEPLCKDVLEGRLDGLLVIAADADAEEATEGEKSKFYSKTKNITDLDTLSTIQRLLNETVTAERYRRHNLSAELIAKLSRSAPLEAIEVSAKASGGESPGNRLSRIMVPFFFMFLMFMGIMLSSQSLLTAVVEEKSSRVIEVLLAAVSPHELMAGKILGMNAMGLTMVGIWGLAAIVAAAYYGLNNIVSAGMLTIFVVYYVLGFTVICALFAALGSACNTFKEAQNLLTPISFLIVLPMLVWMPITQHPDGTLALVLSYIPTTASMVMVLRLTVNPDMPLLQMLGPLAALAASGWMILWLAGKIFRTGILMYGKPPTPRELVRWMMAK